MLSIFSSHRTIVQVTALLVAATTLVGVRIVNPGVALAGGPCIAMPDGSCKPADNAPVINVGGVDSSDVLDPELARQVSLDMPLGLNGTSDHPVVAVDRKQVKFDVEPWINPATNRTLVPIRFISEALGAAVTWTPDQPKDVTITRDGLRIHFLIGDNKADVNGKTVYMDQPSILVNDSRTLVPLRFISEAFGCKVDWVGITGPDDPRMTSWAGGKYQIWIWAPWMYWGNYSLGDRADARNWNLR